MSEHSRPGGAWRFENTALLEALRGRQHRSGPQCRRFDHTVLCTLVASQELAFVLIYDVVRNGRPPSSPIGFAVGALALGALTIRLLVDRR